MGRPRGVTVGLGVVIPLLILPAAVNVLTGTPPAEWKSFHWAALIAALLLTAMMIAIHLRHPHEEQAQHPSEKTSELPPGFLRFSIIVVYKGKTNLVQISDVPKTLSWKPFINAYLAPFNIPQDPNQFSVLDRDAKKWLPEAKTAGGIKAKRLALIHSQDVKNFTFDAVTWSFTLEKLEEDFHQRHNSSGSR